MAILTKVLILIALMTCSGHGLGVARKRHHRRPPEENIFGDYVSPGSKGQLLRGDVTVKSGNIKSPVAGTPCSSKFFKSWRKAYFDGFRTDTPEDRKRGKKSYEKIKYQLEHIKDEVKLVEFLNNTCYNTESWFMECVYDECSCVSIDRIKVHTSPENSTGLCKGIPGSHCNESFGVYCLNGDCNERYVCSGLTLTPLTLLLTTIVTTTLLCHLIGI